ncbi:hypothetical protein [Rhodobacter sp. CZR27]|uniref:hypothetical protein n=1 Tax=Rhodobacter sp. CZR27 TaxID=2033869 RepID=UPI000BBE8308|nr:hypothetical protein [Rhodobacter sp. CZR27]
MGYLSRGLFIAAGFAGSVVSAQKTAEQALILHDVRVFDSAKAILRPPGDVLVAGERGARMWHAEQVPATRQGTPPCLLMRRCPTVGS